MNRMRILLTVLASAFLLSLFFYFYLGSEVKGKPKSFINTRGLETRAIGFAAYFGGGDQLDDGVSINGSIYMRRKSGRRRARILYPPPGGIPLSYGKFVPLDKLIDNPEEFAMNMTKTRLRFELYGIAPPQQDEVRTSPPIRNPDGSPRQVIIMTYFRSGSTFLGDILNNYPGSFYHFEPLHFMTRSRTLDKTDGEEVSYAVSVVQQLLECNYDNLTSYIDWIRKPTNQFLLEHNKRFWGACRIHPRLCFDESFLGAACKEHPLHVMKLVRLRLKEATIFLENNPRLKVVHLVRDPRGMFSSRRTLDWCKNKDACDDPKTICSEMRADLEASRILERDFPGRYLLVRYEDLSLNPLEYSKDLLKFLDLPYDARIRNFVNSHTRGGRRGDERDPYSTRRNSKKTPFLWRQKLSWDQVTEVQGVCGDVLRNLRYKQYDDSRELDSDRIKLDDAEDDENNNLIQQEKFDFNENLQKKGQKFIAIR